MTATGTTMRAPELDAICSTAIDAAHAAAAVQQDCRQRDLTVDQFMAHDVKLEADRLSEDAIVRVIRAFDPDAHILTEESGEYAGKSRYTWIIDPLDGTMNYYQRQHHYCTCIACYQRLRGDKDDVPQKSAGLQSLGTPLVGVVYASAYDELFVARARDGATCNQTTIHPQQITSMKDAMIATSFGSKPDVMPRMTTLITEHLLRSSRKLRIHGCCGLDLCGVAAGKLSALYQADVRIWDFAAARLIIEQAGAKFEAIEFAPGRWNVLASAPGIFDQLHGIVHSV